MRLPLATLEVFTAIARHGSLRAAADALNLKPSTVSHQLKTLEEQLGLALFIRTTRSVSLTEAGRALIRGAGPAFDQLTDAVESARTTGHAARGALKLAMADHVYDLYVSPALPSFCAAYPEIELEFCISDALTDLVEEGLHAGFRIGDRIAQDMVAVRLTPPMALAVVGSPDYLARQGEPDTPRDLLHHNCIRYRFHSSGRIAPWEFQGKEGVYSVDVRGNLINNTLPASIDLARQGLGLAYTFRDYVAQDIASRKLMPVLETHLAGTPGIYIYFPREYRSMMPLRLFMEHLREHVVQN
ncbi:carbonate dehydratase [Leisingera sp. ANG-M1]|uniref:LysR family transcriptional regulator n=1 Tax=Leisingera sp. ANG-M1 TaxID=1577895 RepID=UPI00057EF7A7|nr:LysR family transcriptional regulator [Leisingera sp. ANG-M1]KIC07552.1 carbonate dehydratase [Leisingera sp. ANG-M1]